jgi:hypothetical protein
MNRVFRFEMAVKTVLIMSLAMAIVFAAGCRKKQEKPSKAPPAPVTTEKKIPMKEMKPQQPAVEVNQNTAAAPVIEKKNTVEPPVKEANLSAAPGDKQSSQQLVVPKMPEPEGLKSFKSLDSSETKIDFLSDYADEHPESAALMVYNILDDNDPDVRSAAMEMLAMKEINDTNVAYVAAKALKDEELQVRLSAVEACAAVTDPVVGDVLNEALNDSSEEVRTSAMQMADQKEPVIRLPVLKAGITSKYDDVKENAVSSLIDASSPVAMDILIMGLKDTNPDIRDSVKSAISFLVSQDFDTYEQAYKWWNANRNKFDDELTEKN